VAKFLNYLKSFVSRLSILKNLFVFLWVNKLWWLIPIFIVFIVFGVLIVVSQSSVAVPFIYVLF